MNKKYVVILVLFLVATIALSFSGCVQQVPPFREELYNIADGSEVHGAFSLFGGYIDTEEVYYYYTKNARGAYTLKHFRARNTEIYMDEDFKPYALIYGCYDCYQQSKKDYSSCTRANASIPLVDDTFEPIQQEWVCPNELNPPPPEFNPGWDQYTRVELHLPRGAIVKHYTLDAEL
jgi:hypothetical protein